MDDEPSTMHGVVANSRLTATVGAILFVASRWRVSRSTTSKRCSCSTRSSVCSSCPSRLLKLCTTGYRFVKYYGHDPAYRRKGPPHPILRILAPLVVASTVALLGTGVALLAVGPANSDTLVTAHQASFIVWISVTSIHILGHIVETWQLTAADTGRNADQVPGLAWRRSIVAVAVLVGLGLGVASLGWNNAWAQRYRDRDRRGESATSPR